MTSRSLFRIVLCGGFVSAAHAGQKCRDSAGNSPCSGSNSPCVCVEFAEGTPVQDTDFTLNFSETGYPDVSFRTGSLTWNVWSQTHASNTAPANLGDLLIDASSSTDNFAVEMKNPNNGNPGAVDLKSAVLKDTTSWSGHSSIASGSTITGNLTGNLEVVAASGSGGAVSFTIEGNAAGNITIPIVSSLVIEGDYSGAMVVSEIIGAGSMLEIKGNVGTGSTVTLQNVGTGATAYFGRNSPMAGEYEFAGTLVLEGGVPEGAMVRLDSRLAFPGTIDLTGQNIVGDLMLASGGDGSIVDGGIVFGGVWVAGNDLDFEGSASFESVVEFIRTETGNISGTITVSGDVDGSIGPDPGNLTSTATVSIGGNLNGWVYATSIGAEGNLHGTIQIAGNMSGVIGAHQDLSAEIYVAGNCSGQIFGGWKGNYPGDILGDITIDGVYDGNVCGDNLTPGEIPLNLVFGELGCGATVCDLSPIGVASALDQIGSRYLSVEPSSTYGDCPVALRVITHDEGAPEACDTLFVQADGTIDDTEVLPNIHTMGNRICARS